MMPVDWQCPSNCRVLSLVWTVPKKNVQNAISFLEVQDGVLESAGKIMNRMIELKGLSTDVMKNSSDNANYNREFRDLQQQLFDMGSLKFNGISLFATTTERNGGSAARFNNLSQDLSEDNTVTVIVSSEGNSGPKVSVNKCYYSLLSPFKPGMSVFRMLTVAPLTVQWPTREKATQARLPLSRRMWIAQ